MAGGLILDGLSAGDALTGDLRFPDGFVWGVATSSHQYEGGNTNNQWYAWEERGGVVTGERAGLACNWWAQAEGDFDRAQQIGVNGMRVSLEWSRIEPEEGRWDRAALARYRTMLGELRTRGIEPMVTLHHFTNPLWLERMGGFENPRAIPLFARYVMRCVEALGDQCDLWCTVNEPNIYASLGYLLGIWPPGRKNDLLAVARVLTNLLKAHAAAYRVIHAAQPNARVGLAHHIRIFDPVRHNNPLDRFAAYGQDTSLNGFVLDALRSGHVAGPLRPLAGDLGVVRGTYDYVGINYYTREMVAFDLRRPTEAFGRRFTRPGAEVMDATVSGGPGETFGEIYPDGLRRTMLRAAALRAPIYVTENGFADAADDRRPRALVASLAALHQAVAQGAPVRGYYHWSLVDNFEWAEGWTARFGLIALDELTQERTPRASAEVYARVCQTNAVPAEMLARYEDLAALPTV
jgi:beta-glucosidase